MSIQNKLATALSPLQRKLFDLQVKLQGSSMRVIRLKVIEDKYSDEETRVISNDNIEIVMNIPTEIPLRRLRKIDAGVDETDASPETETGIHLYDLLPIEGYSRFEDKVERGDILIRKLYDDSTHDPLLLILRVSEVVGGFNATTLVWKRFNCAPHNMTLTTEIEQIISEV